MRVPTFAAKPSITAFLAHIPIAWSASQADLTGALELKQPNTSTLTSGPPPLPSAPQERAEAHPLRNALGAGLTQDVFEPTPTAASSQTQVDDADSTAYPMFLNHDAVMTPTLVATFMARLADLKPNQRILEPSAGTGNLALALKRYAKTHFTDSQQPTLDVLEQDPDLVSCLIHRGFEPIKGDFLAYNVKPYDRIVLNPPYSQAQGAAHIQHAFDLLAPDGTLLALIPTYYILNKSQRKLKIFQHWLKDRHEEGHTIREYRFQDPSHNLGFRAKVDLSLIKITKTPTPKSKTNPQGLDYTG